MTEEIRTLAKWLQTSEMTTIFTGAGMSTESGLPDYRSSGGIWSKHDPSQVATPEALNEDFKQFISFYRERIIQMKQYKPNRGHQILAEWQRKGLIHGIITQNVDGFHQMAGSEYVIELHGTLNKARCLGCRKEYAGSDSVINEHCHACQGKLRPCVVLYGEALPQGAFERAFMEARRSQLFVVMGSSLEVSPANMLPLRAKESGARLCIINRDSTNMDQEADLLIRGNIGDVLTEVQSLLKQTSP